uniref:Mitochondrial ribosomal protein S15 n=1 Tax=Panthera leo TaxID=9689 RepID=A0A8C8XM95_PANLE
MLRTAWRALRSITTQAVAQAPVRGLPGGACARPPFRQWGLPSPPGGVILPAVRGYAIQKPVQRSQEDDPSPSTLLKDYQNIPGIEKFDDVVRRLLSLEMASQKEKLKVKQEQLMKKIVANPEDTSSLEARIRLKAWSRVKYPIRGRDRLKKKKPMSPIICSRIVTWNSIYTAEA